MPRPADVKLRAEPVQQLVFLSAQQPRPFFGVASIRLAMAKHVAVQTSSGITAQLGKASLTAVTAAFA